MQLAPDVLPPTPSLPPPGHSTLKDSPSAAAAAAAAAVAASMPPGPSSVLSVQPHQLPHHHPPPYLPPMLPKPLHTHTLQRNSHEDAAAPFVVAEHNGTKSDPHMRPPTPRRDGNNRDSTSVSPVSSSPTTHGGADSSKPKEWNKQYDKARRPRHNLKIPLAHRARFHEPYDNFLSSLLDLLPPAPPAGNQAPLSALPLPAPGKAPRGCNWTVWISTDLHRRFHEGKKVFAPGTTHGQFVEALLLLAEETRRRKAAGALLAMGMSGNGEGSPTDLSIVSVPPGSVAGVDASAAAAAAAAAATGTTAAMGACGPRCAEKMGHERYETDTPPSGPNRSGLYVGGSDALGRAVENDGRWDAS
ncbi:hypothetical protein BDK51DRAFT_48922, partial [Blyttiomyces helicus]